jgi:hypothetical protein
LRRGEAEWRAQMVPELVLRDALANSPALTSSCQISLFADLGVLHSACHHFTSQLRPVALP